MPVGEISQRTATAAPSETATPREDYPGFGDLDLSAANRAPAAAPREDTLRLGSLGLSAESRAREAAELQMDDGLSSLRRERDAALDRVRELEATYDELQRQRGRLEATYDAANQRTGELEAVNQRNGELEAELSRATARGDVWKYECLKLHGEHKRLKAENDRLRTQS